MTCAAHFIVALGESEYEVRHRDGRVTAATRLDVGRHVEPGELQLLAERLGRWAEVQRRMKEEGGPNGICKRD